MRRNTRGTPWWQIGIVAVLLEVIAVALTILFGSIWHLSFPDTIDLGQLVVALLLIPPAVVAFWQARQAVMAAAAHPTLRLAFLSEDGLLQDSYIMDVPASGGSANRVTLALENTGNAIAVWWQATFDIPVELMKSLRFGNNTVNVMPRHVPTMTMDTVGSVERRVVQSAGTVGLFPGPPLQIASLQSETRGQIATDIEREYQLDYELLTDRTDPVVGRLPLTIRVKPRS